MVERDDERQISAPEQRDDQDSAMRPQRLADFVGQHKGRDNLSVFIQMDQYYPLLPRMTQTIPILLAAA